MKVGERENRQIMFMIIMFIMGGGGGWELNVVFV